MAILLESGSKILLEDGTSALLLETPTAVTDTESGAGTDAGEAVAVALSDSDTGSALDAGEAVAGTVSDTESAAATDAEAAPSVAVADTETATATDDESGTPITVSVFDSDSGAADDEEAVAVVLADDDPATATDAGEQVGSLATVSDTDTATAVDDANPPDAGGPVTDSDTASATDAGEALAVTITDTDTGTGVDAELVAVPVSDADSGTAVDAGENVAMPAPITITIGGQPVVDFSVDSPTQITLVVPDGTPLGPGAEDVIVTNFVGSSPISPADIYTYLSAATVFAIISITTPDAVGRTDFSTPVIVYGTIAVRWSGVDDVDTTVATWIAKSGNPAHLGDGILVAPDEYATTVDTTLLSDGTHSIEPDGVDSDGNEGFGPGVLIVVNNGGGPTTAAAASNPDFQHVQPAAQLAQHVEVARAALPVDIHPAIAQAVIAVTADLDQRDKLHEDYLNRNVVRRVWPLNQLGADHAHSDSGFIDVVPLSQVTVQKASPRSVLVVQLGVSGQYNDDSPPHYVDMGVHVEGPNGYDHTFLVGRATGQTNHETMSHPHVCAVAGDADQGTYTVTLVVRTQHEGSVAWLSTNNDTISFSVTETPQV